MIIKVLHEWSKPTPEFVAEALSRFGNNPFGQPLFRVVWSETQTHKVWKRNDEGRLAEHTLLTYPGVQRWILETWCPPHKYGPKFIWERQEQDNEVKLGPYPSKGMYEHSYTLEHDKQFVQLTLPVLEIMCYMILQSKETTLRQKRDALYARNAQEDKLWEQRASDIIKDSMSPFYGQPMVGFGGNSKRNQADDIKFNKTKLPSKLKNQTSFFQI